MKPKNKNYSEVKKMTTDGGLQTAGKNCLFIADRPRSFIRGLVSIFVSASVFVFVSVSVFRSALYAIRHLPYAIRHTLYAICHTPFAVRSALSTLSSVLFLCLARRNFVLARSRLLIAGGCLVFFCLLSSVALAQVVVQSDMFADLEEGLEREQALHTREAAVIETELSLKKDAAIFEQSAPVVREKDFFQAPAVIDQSRILSEEEVLRINDSLRRAIEQSRRLKEEKNRVDQELRSLRGEQRLERRRAELMEMQVKDYQARADRSVQMKEEFDRTVADLQEKIQVREQALLSRIQELQGQLERHSREDALPVSEPVILAEDSLTHLDRGLIPREPRDESFSAVADAPSDDKVFSVVDARQKGLDVIDLLNDLDAMRQKIRDDEAKIYYNMGNIFYHQGKYQDAVTEYRKALEITPSDVNAHFNLAYISGEFLREYETALEHYQQYLFLNPAAEDGSLVREKILEMQLFLSMKSGPAREEELRKNKQKMLYSW